MTNQKKQAEYEQARQQWAAEVRKLLAWKLPNHKTGKVKGSQNEN